MKNCIEEKLKEGYTLIISKHNDSFRGTFLLNEKDGVHYSELPKEETKFLSLLEGISREINKGAILQISMQGFCTVSKIGYEKTAGPYCETKYLEQIHESKNYDYVESLIELNKKMAVVDKSKSKELIKLRKGVCKYE